MKILQINTVCGTGSTGRIATDIHNILLEEGYESYIAYGRGEAKNIAEKYTIKIGNKYDMYVHGILTRLFDRHGLASKKATEEFIKKIEKLNPDVIHLHNIHGYYLNYQILFRYLKQSNKKVIWTLHDSWSYTGHCAYYDYVKCEKWKTQCKNCPQKEKYPTTNFIDNSFNNYNLKKESFLGVRDLTIVTPSKWLGDEVKKSFLKNYKIQVINNGIDLKNFKPTKSDFIQKYNLENKFIILGVASVWDERKGIKYFYELSNKLEANEKIVLVGLNKNQLKELPKNILGIERTNSVKELAEIYTTSDVFVNPTLEEVQGLTNLEAQACGTFGITFNTGGSPECYSKETGIVVGKENLEELIKAIRKIKKEGYDSKKCTERSRKNYSKDEKFREYINNYL
ncbi:MAG: glycosyltransferase [Fusobacterium sp.]